MHRKAGVERVIVNQMARKDLRTLGCRIGDRGNGFEPSDPVQCVI